MEPASRDSVATGGAGHFRERSRWPLRATRQTSLAPTTVRCARDNVSFFF